MLGDAAAAGGLAAEVSANRSLYLYLLVATCAVFAGFGYQLGGRVDLLRRTAARDHLTGLATRLRLFEFLDQEFAEAVRYRRPLSFVMLDVDHFKRVNDLYGHALGDEVLRAIARILLESKRRSDVAARFGGEEFLLVLPETTVDEAAIVAERIRQRIAAFRLSARGEAIAATVSLGVAGGVPAGTDWVDRLIAAADQALYEAKGSGRNRVVTSHE